MTGHDHGRAEVEELSVVRVARRGRPRIGLTGALAAVALVALVATGFGALGGRSRASPSPSTIALASQSAPTPAPPTPRPPLTAPPIEPQVTPWTPCAPSPMAPPDVVLEVDGRQHPGALEVVWSAAGAPSAPPVIFPGPSAGPPAAIDIPAYVPTDLWIVGAACATGWSLELVGVSPLTSFVNPQGNPDFGSQNRFGLFLAPFGGWAAVLEAVLSFPAFTARATWPVVIQPWPHPAARLSLGNESVEAAEGCNVEQTLPDVGNVADSACPDAVRNLPREALAIRFGDDLEFTLSGGPGPEVWQIREVSVSCGRLDELAFIYDECPIEGARLSRSGAAIVPAPDATGRWTLEVSACGVVGRLRGDDRVCGTWYVYVDVTTTDGP